MGRQYIVEMSITPCSHAVGILYINKRYAEMWKKCYETVICKSRILTGASLISQCDKRELAVSLRQTAMHYHYNPYKTLTATICR